ncbi:hypothetical protein LOTGIDRAFT_175773 [Lottia gigantea]|uniref:Uncharacterized protein n=1 Tax=Lottia gigantea TaxID=225164 RepID=V3ZJR6_LOTGI|nr:hypothetical protein LOTGIDRAFT_175773 [Lottia gigantea]ESO91528.1 hypothetical protein LOTGIDRAFT_175773 [Lottia gigantea]
MMQSSKLQVFQKITVKLLLTLKWNKVGNVLPAKVADIIKHMFNTKQADDRSKGIMEKYLRPGNIELYPQKINTEIWGHLKKETQFKDIDSFKLSEKLIKCSYAVMSLVELLLKSKKQDKKSDDKDSSLSSGIKTGMDALSLLGHIVQDHNQIRRDSLKVDLNLQYKKLCNPSHNTDTGSSKWLFGDELGKRVKDIKETNQVGSSVASGSRLYKSVSRFNSRSKPFLSQGNSHYKRPPQNQSQYRFSNKKYSSHQRSSYNQNKKNQSEKK